MASSDFCQDLNFIVVGGVNDRGNPPGGWRTTEYMYRTFSVGYFAFAQYDEKEERSHSVKSYRSCRGDFFMQKIGVMLILYNYIKKYI